MKKTTLALLACAATLGACHHPLPETTETTQPPAVAAAPPATPPASQAPVPATPGAAPVPPPPPPPPAKIRILVRSNPSKAEVRWGRKKLGITPLAIERPRDSGPVDLILRDDGYLPVHVRAYTFRNDAFTVHLTKVEDELTLFGAKQPAEVTATGPVPAPPGSLLPVQNGPAPPGMLQPPSALAAPGTAPPAPPPPAPPPPAPSP
jgi:hypothetical protein